MSYTLPSTITPAHYAALRVDPRDLEALSPHDRFALDLRLREIAAKKREAFWAMVQGVGALLVFLGLVSRVIVQRLVQLADGTVRIVVNLPGQAIRTWQIISPEDRAAVIKFVRAKLPLGDDAFKEDSLARALPFLALGIVGVVALNIWRTAR